MRTSRVVVGVAVAVGVAAGWRQRREAARTRAGALRPLGAHGRAEGEEDRGHLHARLATWQPPLPRSRAGRVAGAVWAAPLTALGLLAVLAGGRLPRWDDEVGALVARGVRGPARWFLHLQSANAATLGQVVVARDDDPDPRLLAHEAVHARQQERLGPLFAVAYPVAGATWGYRNNPFEVAARAGARLSGPAGSA